MDSMQLLSFESTAHRVLYRYEFSFADFAAVESDAVSVGAQKAFYGICKAIVMRVTEAPETLGLSVALPDKWLGAHEIMKMHPDVYKVRNDCQKAFVNLAAFLFTAGQFGVIEGRRLVVRKTDLPKTTAKLLGFYTDIFSNSGIVMTDSGDALSFETASNPDAIAAWKLLAEVCAEKGALYFLLWIHDNDGAYFLERVRHLLDLEEDFFLEVDKIYRSTGYLATFTINEYRTNIIYSKGVSGLLIAFSTLWPTVRFVNDSSIGIKAILESAAELDADFVRQLVRFCKPCNDCLGCTKGGKNRQFTVEIPLGSEAHRVCPEFVQMEWYNNDISMEKIEFLFALNELQEKYGKIK